VALSTFPLGAAATRFRIGQFLPHLSEQGVRVTLLPFLNENAYRHLYDRKNAGKTALRLLASLARRIVQLPRILRADLVMIQREAMLFGPPWIEWLVARVARIPVVLDLDDATWIPLPSPVYGRLAKWLKSPAKTDRLIRWARIVVCGNETVAGHVRGCGTRAVVMPTIVDTSQFVPRADGVDEVPVVGWIGTHSTWKFVEPLLPILEQVAELTPFRLRIVGSGCTSVSVRGVDVELLPWSLDREVLDFQSLDVGLYPMPDDRWTAGKSGLKLIQYFAAGVASVASPVGIVKEIGVAGTTHLHAATLDEWRLAVGRLLRDDAERRSMAAAARRYAVEHYSVTSFAARLADVVRQAAATAEASA
jgi:glycosyltransferase involved in cell wall biosynthesis